MLDMGKTRFIYFNGEKRPLGLLCDKRSAAPFAGFEQISIGVSD
jgi:hypothetical protein